MGVAEPVTGERGSGEICINGAAARLVRTGDKIIIMSHAYVTAEEAAEVVAAALAVDEGEELGERLPGDLRAFDDQSANTHLEVAVFQRYAEIEDTVQVSILHPREK